MKIKLGLFSLVMVLLALGTGLGGGNPAAANQNIGAEVTIPSTSTFGYQEIALVEDTAADNQTIETTNPTFKEVKDFILKDTTSRNPFITGKYECRHFATDVNNNAEAEGIRCAFVLLCYENGQHAVVGFETVDRGMIYIEPQTDAVINPAVGGRYQEQKIVEILVCW